MRVIGLDIHRTFAQVAILSDGKLQDHGRFSMDREAVLGFATKGYAEEAAVFGDGLLLNFGMRDQRRDWFDFLALKGLASGSLNPLWPLMDAPVP
ncbi:hypothetical protein F6X40_41765 [Paraburkholderia sp. UCT31]|uniref:hypothetical protein n=1 Tax=Paraburkholderia sp. UCT31 TaxID=2615209 RepID=UPI0016557C44|nr:hypothetical protein [Paraburkholderia sp. UCT31]MBC8742981.1 hypothetical protein [Paraburkholderia sp. UCT31]